MKKTEKRSRVEEQPTLPLLEKIVAICGLTLVLSLLGMIGYEAAFEKEKDPEIRLVIRETKKQADGFLVKFEAKNIGTLAAREVSIEGRAGEETSQVTLDYLPGKSTRAGGLFFTKEPSQLTLRALGFQEP